MKRTRITALGIVLLACLLPVGAQDRPATAKPNIILILSDDVVLGDIGCCGGAFKTPQIDSLAKGGTRFEYCYSTPLCGSSRCETLTGRYPFRTGLINNNSHNAIQPGREIMIPTVLKKAGYVTASAGKWGQMCLGTGEWGFDEYIVFPGSGRYWREQTRRYTVNGEQKDLADGQYLPDIMHEFIVNFITHHKEGPCVVKHDGRYYRFYSGANYQTARYGADYVVADHPLAPYTGQGDHARVLHSVPDKVRGPGHHSIVPSPDGRAQYLVYHAWDPAMKVRWMCIDKLLWTPEVPRGDGPTFTPQPAP